jgi:CheY-like chemotaxis protein
MTPGCPPNGECPVHGDPVVPRPPTVLCIDDDPLVLHCYRSVLAPQGYRVLTATDGLQGLALATADRPDVILLDVLLRGLSGYDICRKCRRDPALREIPIILLTAWDHPSVGQTGRAAGAARTLQKPADPETIVAAIQQVLGLPCDPAAG